MTFRLKQRMSAVNDAIVIAMQIDSSKVYEQKKANVLRQFHRIKGAKQISLKPKKNTHFLRKRIKTNTLDLSAFTNVLRVDTDHGLVEAEGLTSFFDLFAATSTVGYMPVVVPEFRAITIGGAIAGLGVEATSFRYGLVHENILEMDIITGTGDILTVTPQKHRDLFLCMPNSLGTLGYVLRAVMRITPIKRFIRVDIRRFRGSGAFIDAIRSSVSSGRQDFLEGLIVGPEEYILAEGSWTDKTEQDDVFDVSVQSWYRYLTDARHQRVVCTAADYMWRWDTDVFWGTRELGFLGSLFDRPVLRRTILKPMLRSDRLLKLHHMLAYHPWFPNVFTGIVRKKEQLIQDVGITIDRCEEFLWWYQTTIGMYPLWACPGTKAHAQQVYPLYQWKGNVLVDFGFYGYKRTPAGVSDHYYTTLVEQHMLALGGIKGLYSTSYFTPHEFWGMHDRDAYMEAEKRYDPNSVFPELYDKVVGDVTK